MFILDMYDYLVDKLKRLIFLKEHPRYVIRNRLKY